MICIVNDASCLIDLHKGGLLQPLCCLPYHFLVPLPVRESELLTFTPQEWALLEEGGMVTSDLPPEQVINAYELKSQHGRLSANDCFCLVTAQCHSNSILLTGDRLLGEVAKRKGVQVHGVLWVIDELLAANVCDQALLRQALETWQGDPSVFLPEDLINHRLRRL